MDELIQAMSIPELEKFKASYPTNESIQKIVDGYIAVRHQEEAKIKAKAEFEATIAKLVGKLPHPDDVYNVYLAWREVEIEDTSQAPEEVVVNGTKELRHPKTKVAKWVVELNKGFQVSKGSTTTLTGSTKRAITVKKVQGDTLAPAGNFHSASEACKHLKLTIGGDSAMRVLQREGYLTSPYDGTAFTVTS